MKHRILICAIMGCFAVGAAQGQAPRIWVRDNLLAWCVLEFDSKNRGPEERARMLRALGFKHFAYNWREEDIPQFDAEIAALKGQGIELAGWALYGSENPHTQRILDTFERNGIHPPLWLMQSPRLRDPEGFAKIQARWDKLSQPEQDAIVTRIRREDLSRTPQEQAQRIADEADKIAALVKRAAPYGSTVQLYNHNGWFGMVENQVALIERLKELGIDDVSMVYNFSHARDALHDDSQDFPRLWQKMQPYVAAVNITGMRWDGRFAYPSQGDSELDMMRTIERSGWRGLVGVIAESGGDAESTLQSYLTGLDWLAAEIQQPGSAGSKPFPALVDEKKRPIGNVTAPRLLNGQAESGEWLTGGRDYQQSYYSPLTQIDADNVEKLALAWSLPIICTSAFESTPLVVDGVMFASGTRGNVYSLDAATGALRWSFEPQIDLGIFRKHSFGGVNRGVAVWHGKVYVASVDGYLYALDAANGAVVWKVDTIADRTRAYSSTGAPYIAKDVVVIGNSGAEFDVRGYVTAYDVSTGKQKWRFFTVPGDPKRGFEHPELKNAAQTWDRNSRWDLGLGGTAWDGMAYDPKLDLLYVATGNGTPWNAAIRSPAGGDNLFLSSILAIRPATGRLVWYYQTTPAETWDYAGTQKLVLTDLKIKGRLRHVLMQAPKNGFFYVLDRTNGKLLSAKPYAYVNWASHIDLQTGRPVRTGKADFSREPKLIFPAPQGAHSWHPMAFNPRTGLVYLPVLESGAVFGPLLEPFVYRKDQWNLGLTVLQGELSEGMLPKGWPSLASLRAGEPDPRRRTFLRAWDPVRQASAWEVETTPADEQGSPAGLMATASGLVFQGQADGRLLVFDARTGKELRSIEVGSPMVAAPMTYTAGGEQYVAIMAGTSDAWDSDRNDDKVGRIVALKLNGKDAPASLTSGHGAGALAAPPVADTGSAEQIALGGQLFASRCAMCHESAGRAPDLAKLNAQGHRDFLDIVLKGSRQERGMPGFGAVLSAEEAEALHAYIIRLSWERYRKSSSIPTSSSAEIAAALATAPPPSPPEARPGKAPTVFTWDGLKFKPSTDGEHLQQASIFYTRTRTLDFLGAHASRLAPGHTNHPAHRHPGEDELVLVLAGTLEVYVNGTTQVVGPQSVLLFMENDWHQLKNVGKEDASYIALHIAPDLDWSTGEPEKK